MAHKKHKTLRTPNAGNTIHNSFSLLKDLRKYYGDKGCEITNWHESSKTILISSFKETVNNKLLHIMPRDDNELMDDALANRLVNAFGKSLKNGSLAKEIDSVTEFLMKQHGMTEDEVNDGLWLGIIDRTACDLNVTRVQMGNNSVTLEEKHVKKPILSFCLYIKLKNGGYLTSDFTM